MERGRSRACGHACELMRQITSTGGGAFVPPRSLSQMHSMTEKVPGLAKFGDTITKTPVHEPRDAHTGSAWCSVSGR
jgi:hypothetical protein